LNDKDKGLKEFVEALNRAFAAKDEVAAQMVIEQMVSAPGESPTQIVTGAENALGVLSKLPQASEPRWTFAIGWLQWKKSDIPAARKTMDKVLASMDKLSDSQKEAALGFSGSLYMQTPDPDNARAKDIFLQLLRLTPDDYKVYNNLACNPAATAQESLEYGKKAYDLMLQNRVYEPLVADTYGWSMVQSGNERDLDAGLNVLLEAWNTKHIADIAYHIGDAYCRKNNGADAEKYLIEAQNLYNEALSKNQVSDMTLQLKINSAREKASKLKAKPGS
jgi:hypothetical protein